MLFTVYYVSAIVDSLAFCWFDPFTYPFKMSSCGCECGCGICPGGSPCAGGTVGGSADEDLPDPPWHTPCAEHDPDLNDLFFNILRLNDDII